MKIRKKFTSTQRHHRQYAKKKGYKFGNARGADRLTVYFDEQTTRSGSLERNLVKDGFVVKADPNGFRTVRPVHDYYIVSFNE
jgi:hypothetical protein